MAESRSPRARAAAPRSRRPARAAPAAGPPVAEPGPAQPSGPICSVAFCPICLAVSAVGDVKPELVEHLLLAGREMLLAIRTVIDQRLETMEEASAATLQRITIE